MASFHIAKDTADFVFNLANLMLIVGTGIVLGSTILAIWMGTIKERYGDERISSNETATAKANAEAEKAKENASAANERAAKLEKEAAEARLQLQRLRMQVAPRQIQRDKFLSALAGQPKANVEIMYLKDDPECFDVAQQVWRLLEDAGWKVSPPSVIPTTWANLGSNLPTAMSVDGQPSGVTIVTDSATPEEAEAGAKMVSGKDFIKTPWTVLQYAFLEALGKTSGSSGGESSPHKGTLRVVVAPR